MFVKLSDNIRFVPTRYCTCFISDRSINIFDESHDRTAAYEKQFTRFNNKNEHVLLKFVVACEKALLKLMARRVN